MVRLKLRAIGTSVGVILPKEILARLKIGQGDEMMLTEIDGGVQLSAYDATVEEQIDLGREFMKDYRDTFRALAK